MERSGEWGEKEKRGGGMIVMIAPWRWIITFSCQPLAALTDTEVISPTVALTQQHTHTPTHTLTHQVHHDGGAVAVGLSGPIVLWSQQIKSLALPTSSLWQCWRGCLCVSVCDPDTALSVWEAGCLLSSIQGAYPLIRLKAAQDYIRKYS